MLIPLVTGTKFEDIRVSAQQLAKNKPIKKSLLKAAEELNELSTAILQYVNKGGDLERIEEEFVDVLLNLEVLSNHLDYRTVVAFLEQKHEKMLKVKSFTKYVK